MYNPIQIPYILNREYSQHMKYSEEPATSCGGFVICFWDMQPISNCKLTVNNIIAADACIDLVVGFDEGTIGFAGMSKTVFDFQHTLPARSFGARMMPGAFFQLTGLPASAAMDTFLPIEDVDTTFDRARFFALPYAQAKAQLRSFLSRKAGAHRPDLFTGLFHTLSAHTPDRTKELYELLRLSPRQCQRLFATHYGITPKMALCIVRFQKCLEILTSSKAMPADILNATNYYDQPHFINDFKRNMGITPLELIRRYRN